MAQRTSTDAALPQIKPATLREFHARLAGWYAAHGRHDLPWRKTTDGYAIWLSEVMLQQTQVATVLARFYYPFLEKFPTIESLATAPRESVMKAWEGLGYYSRAGNLHKAAQLLCHPEHSEGSPSNFGRSFDFAQDDKSIPYRSNRTPMPDTFDALISLPGIGRNTAHAILAFAHHQPVAIMEANVKRIVTRIFAWETPTDQQLWAGAAALLNAKSPFDYNQAMMDLGNLICTPKKPACDICPAFAICLGKKAPELYPTPKTKKQIPTRDVTILVQEDSEGRLYLETRGERLLGGLYGFPQITAGSVIAGEVRPSTLAEAAKDGLPRRSAPRNDGAFLGHVVHVYSHFRLEGKVQHLKLTQKMTAKNWHTREEINALPLSGVDHKVLALIDNCNSRKRNTRKPKAKTR